MGALLGPKYRGILPVGLHYIFDKLRSVNTSTQLLSPSLSLSPAGDYVACVCVCVSLILRVANKVEQFKKSSYYLAG